MDSYDVNSRNDSVKEFLTYSLATVVLCGLLFVQGAFSSFMAFFTIAPPTLYYIKQKRLTSAFAIIIIAAISVFLFAGIDGATYYLYEFGVLNVFLILALKNEADFTKIVFRSSFMSYLAILIAVCSLSIIYKVNIHNAIVELIEQNVSDALKAYEKVPMTAEQAAQFKEIFATLAEMFKKVYPALIFIGFEIIAVINLLILNALFLKKEKKLDTASLLIWSPSESFVWGVIFFGFLYFVKSPYTEFAALNGLILFLTLYFFSGLCIIAYLFKQRNVSVFIQGLFYLIMITVAELKYIVIALGIFNIWFDFRKKRVASPKNE